MRAESSVMCVSILGEMWWIEPWQLLTTGLWVELLCRLGKVTAPFLNGVSVYGQKNK